MSAGSKVESALMRNTVGFKLPLDDFLPPVLRFDDEEGDNDAELPLPLTGDVARISLLE